MSSVAAGLGRLLIQGTAAFLVIGTGYLLLFDPNAGGRTPLSPAQVAENLAPIGRVHLSATATTEPPAATRQDAAAPADVEPAPIEPVEPVASSTAAEAAPAKTPAPPVATEPQAAETSAVPAAESAADEPDPVVDTSAPESETKPPASAAQRLHAPWSVSASAPNGLRLPDAPIELKRDRNGMHGVYQRTPAGIVLYPSAVEPATMDIEAVQGIIGFLRMTPFGYPYFQIVPESAQAPRPGR